MALEYRPQVVTHAATGPRRKRVHILPLTPVRGHGLGIERSFFCRLAHLAAVWKVSWDSPSVP
jgi:hypothetical protein